MAPNSQRNGKSSWYTLLRTVLTLFVRLQVTIAKIQQTLPELKRDGSNVLSAVSAQQLYGKNSTPTAGGVLEQTEFIPKITKQLQDEPDVVISKFEKIRELSVYIFSS